MRKVGKYLLVERIGHGGMGELFLAKLEGHQGWNRNFALKQMLPEMAKYLDYFTSEAFIGGRLNHPSIVAVLDYFVDDEGRHNIVMEYIEGLNVLQILDVHQRLAPPMAVYIARASLRGLAYVHGAFLGPTIAGPLVHRDLSLDNIMVTNGADVKIADFGIAKARGMLREETQADGFRGKLAYASPEQLLGQALDGRADVYQIGVCLYEMLSGYKAFPSASSTYHAARQVAQIIEGETRPLLELVPTLASEWPELAPAVATLMHKDRNQRPYAEDARALLKRACSACDDAEGTLASFVRQMTKKKRRPTSTWNVAGDVATPPAPPQGGVILTALPDMETQRISPAEAVAAVAKREQTVSGKAKAIAPAGGVIAIEVPREVSPRDANAPAAEMPMNRYAASEPRTEVLDPPPRRSKLLAGPALLVFSLVLLLVAGGIVVVYTVVHARQNVSQQPQAPQPGVTEPNVQPRAQPKEPPESATPKNALAAPITPPPAPPIQETRKEVKQEKGSRSKSCKVPPPEGAGLIVADKENQPVRVWVDDILIGPAPIQGYPVDPGKHQVTLERGDARESTRTTSTVRVSAGHCYTVNRHSPSAPALLAAADSSPVPAPASPPKSYKQLYDEAQDEYVKNACSHAQALARQAAKVAPDRKGQIDAYRILAGASCCSHDAAGVAEAWGHLDEYGHTFARYVCGRYGTELPKP